MTLYVTDDDNQITQILDSVYGKTVVTASSGIGDNLRRNLSLWANNNGTIFLAKSSDAIYNTEIQITANGVTPTECTVMVWK